MGWFAIACTCGFLGFWLWRSQANLLVQRYNLSPDRAGLRAAVVAFLIVAICLILWAIYFQHAQTPDDVVDAFYHGQVARFLLGLLLGAGSAFVIEQRSRADSMEEEVKSRLLPAHLVLSTGIGILVLALTAPYVDGWLQRAIGIKSPVIEIQLAGSTTHRVSVAEGISILFSVHSLQYLQSYDERIRSDIEYFQNYGQSFQDRKEIVNSAQRLLPAFNYVLGPVARCVQTAINEGWLSIDGARQIVAPTADLLEQIIFGDEMLRQNGNLEAKHNQFWQQVTKIPEMVAARVSIPVCAAPRTLPDYPRFERYKNLPYLHAAAALFISFMGDANKALQVLQRASDLRKTNGQPMLDFKDYTFLFAMGRLIYYQGRPGDVTNLYFGPLNELRTVARGRIEELERAKQECKAALTPICYAQIYEITAINLSAYYLAEDLARGNESAKNYMARIREYTNEIKRVTDDIDNHVAKNNAFFSYVEDDEYGLLDTYAYATLVLEAAKANPDTYLIRKEAVDVLRRVVEHREESILSNSPQIDMVDLAQLKISQAHFESAKEQVGE